MEKNTFRAHNITIPAAIYSLAKNGISPPLTLFLPASLEIIRSSNVKTLKHGTGESTKVTVIDVSEFPDERTLDQATFLTCYNTFLTFLEPVSGVKIIEGFTRHKKNVQRARVLVRRGQKKLMTTWDTLGSDEAPHIQIEHNNLVHSMSHSDMQAAVSAIREYKSRCILPQQSPALPRELEREIVTITAFCRPQLLPPLILVCQRFRAWLVPPSPPIDLFNPCSIVTGSSQSSIAHCPLVVW